jgi:hypothetical protein
MAHYLHLDTGYAWRGSGVAQPHYGAFAEGFEVGGSKSITAVRLCLATVEGLWMGQHTDVYIWEGGVTSPPGAVLAVLTGAVPESVPVWPNWAENDFPITVGHVEGEIAAGFWVDSKEAHAFFILADESGIPGHPWTQFAPDSGYDTGWGHPNLVPDWAGCQTLGIAVQVETSAAPVELTTWGNVKALFE